MMEQGKFKTDKFIDILKSENINIAAHDNIQNCFLVDGKIDINKSESYKMVYILYRIRVHNWRL